MSGLPKPELPQYEHYLTGIKKKVKYRPFTNKEQKILLLAKESEKTEDIINAMKQVVDNCLITKIDRMPIFDFEDIYLRIRSKSVSEETELHYRYKETGEDFSIKIDLNEVKVKHTQNDNVIKISEDMAIVMQYPTIDSFKLSQDEFVLDCIQSVCYGEEVYTFNEYTKEQQHDWVDNLDSHTVLSINKFLENIPSLEHEEEVTLKDKRKIKVKLKGLNDFFT